MRTTLAIALVVMAALGARADEWPVTTAAADNAHPTWCGGYIAFQSDRDTQGVFQIWGASDTGELRSWRITNQPWRTFTEPSWNCGQRYVVFQGSHGGGPDSIWVVFDSGFPSPVVAVPQATADNEAPSYLLGKIAFHSDRNGQDDIYLMSEGGEGNWVTRLTTNAAADVQPAISPDGQWIAFSSDRAGDDFDIWITGPGGEADTLRRVTATSGRDSEPAWSPGGTHIAFARSDVGIVVIDVASRTEYQVTSNGMDSSPAWSPEGDLIAFTRYSVYDHIWCSDNLPPETDAERASWGSIKALYR